MGQCLANHFLFELLERHLAHRGQYIGLTTLWQHMKAAFDRLTVDLRYMHVDEYRSLNGIFELSDVARIWLLL